jgi:hypothetical protein
MDHVVLNDIPRFAAIILVALGERFNALAIFLTPFLAFAIDFNVRRSSLVHRTTFLFLAKSRFLSLEPGLVPHAVVHR